MSHADNAGDEDAKARLTRSQAFDIVAAALPGAKADSVAQAAPPLCTALAESLAAEAQWALRLRALQCAAALCKAARRTGLPAAATPSMVGELLPAALPSADDKLSQV